MRSSSFSFQAAASIRSLESLGNPAAKKATQKAMTPGTGNGSTRRKNRVAKAAISAKQSSVDRMLMFESSYGS